MTTTINGTTGINRVQDGTVSQADLAANVAGNGPAFYAYSSSAQTTTANTALKVLLTSELFDTNSCYDTSVSRFIPNVAGYYYVSASSGWPTDTSAICWIYKNGNTAIRGNYLDNYCRSMAVAGLIYMNGTTDYLEFYIQTGAATTYSSGQSETNFQGYLARAA